MARGIIDRALRLGESRQFKEYEKRVSEINRFEPEMELLDDGEIRAYADELRRRAREDDEPLADLLPEAFALAREAGKRAMGQRHYDVQLIGGMVLHDGAIAEMKTGEGKTLTATSAVFLNTLAGDGVHLVTVNDYLARRDAEWMAPIYEALGVSVASAMYLSVTRGLRSSASATSRVASSETCRPIRLKRFWTASSSSGVTSTLRPLTSIRTAMAPFRR